MSKLNGQDANKQIYGVYLNSLLTHKIKLHITEVGKRVRQNLEIKLRQMISNKCIEEGYVSPVGIEIVQYSSGNIANDFIEFQVVFSCWIAHPINGMILECTIKTITKAGIHAQVIDREGNVPITVFIARDHNNKDPRFHQVKEGDKILSEVIGTRYELNDPYICAIAHLVTKPTNDTTTVTEDRKGQVTNEKAIDVLYSK